MPEWKTAIKARLADLKFEGGREAEIVEEISQHLEDRFAEARAAGATEEEARRAALEELREGKWLETEWRRIERPECLDRMAPSGRKGNMLEELYQDLRYGARMLGKKPGFTAVAVLTLALGIGATTAIFSAVYGVLIDPYPYARCGEIWAPGLKNAQDAQIMRPYQPEEYRTFAAMPEFSEVMGTSPGSILMTGEFAPEMLTAPHLTLNAFQFLEVPPVIGREFGPGDVAEGGEPQPVTVISYRLWQRLFGGDPKAIGRTLRLEDKVYTIIGVMPSRFGWWTGDGLWLPMANKPGVPGRIFPIARLKAGANASAARQRWHALQVEMAKTDPGGFPNTPFESTLTNYLDITVASGTMQQSLRVLFFAVGFLLLIACANVASLQLARASGRSREMAVRLAIGAGRGRLMRQLLTESVLLSVAGGLLGLVFAAGLTRLLVVLMPSFYVPNESRIEINGLVLVFCMLVSVLTGIVFGLAPALQSSRPNLTDALKEEGRGSSGAEAGKFRSGLVVAEVAFSVVLLVSAGLTTRSFLAIQNIDPGFHAEHVVTIGFVLPATRYRTLEQRNQFCREFLEGVQRLPGVEAAEAGNFGLPFGGANSPYSIDGQAGTGTQPLLNLVGADYLKTMGIPLRRGRNLTEQDVLHGDRFAVINESAAKLWPAGEDPIGRQIRLEVLKGIGGEVLMPSNASPEMTVVGICGDTHNDGLTSKPVAALFLPYTLVAPPDRTLGVRALGDPKALVNSVREVARRIDPELPLRDVRTVAEIVQDESIQPRFTMVLFSLFGLFGLALATAGIYSVLSYAVTQRTREIGVRMALGAQRGDVLGLILKDGGRLTVLGILLGTLASLAAARFVASQITLFQVDPTDLISFLGVALLLGGIGAIACWLPARRATKVDPMTALRHE